MRITFILTGSGHKPVGGFKVVYEYANRLAKMDNLVNIIHPAWVRRDEPLLDRMKRSVRYIQRAADKSYVPDNWFPIEASVKVLWRPNLCPRFIPDSDIVVATGAPTAEWVDSYGPEKGKKFYLLQHHETWDSIGRKRVDATYLMPLRKIAISRWLREIAKKNGSDATYIPNGLDQEKFFIERELEARDKTQGIMLYHPLPEKGTGIGIRACEILRERVGNLKLMMFGVYDRPSNLPHWISYEKSPSLPKLRGMYNSASFVVAPSVTEGWGLVPCEAMQCGCALVATDAGGHLEFAVHNDTALISPVLDAVSLANNIELIISNDELRKSIALAGAQYVKKFSWEKSAAELNAMFLEAYRNA
ncbi:glycosyltransferase family 4 protein [Paraburkholderia fungorum]|uniref:Glycosyltransferase family 4 protein n=1 Tax=Paraburkholderia fungorum TaxID=134537 RepID=A0AAP5UTE1_9BURK|nr:glycosyltransferase family 4 protein [Paraburkholderia fungorum]MDT8838260.1 glycosyltransferase family 4 protein [Paraburkholderia fungorum]PRZ51900.1 glycosyltransferase involved in cell wall biosynthesis [Paraburkholderia fungorum]